MHKIQSSNCIVQVQPNWKSKLPLSIKSQKYQTYCQNAKIYSKISKKNQRSTNCCQKCQGCHKRFWKISKEYKSWIKMQRSNVLCKLILNHHFPSGPLQKSTVKNIKNSFNCTEREKERNGSRFSGSGFRLRQERYKEEKIYKLKGPEAYRKNLHQYNL